MVEFSEDLLRLVTCQTHSQVQKVNPMKPFLIGFVFAVGLHASLLTFSNSATISIPDHGPSIPYPSQIDVPDIGDPSSMTVELLGINHTFPKRYRRASGRSHWRCDDHPVRHGGS